MAGPNDIYGLDEETGQPLTQSELGLAPPEPDLRGVDPETGLPVVIGSGRILSPQESGSANGGNEAGSKGDPYYDPEADLFHFLHGTVAEPDWGDGEIQMDATDAGPRARAREGASVSAGFKGMTDEGIAMSDKLFGPAYERANQKNAVLGEQYQADVARMRADTDIRKESLAALAVLEIEHFDNVAEVRRQQVELNTKARRAEELAAAESRANADQYIAHYNQEMANLRPLLMQTGNPLGGLTAVQGGAMGAALFAQGFLGARYGIKVDVAGQINRWVEQEMAAHQNKVSNMMAGANAQLKLYDIARQQGLDDQMTRDRLRGFAIDALKSNLYMEAARYQSSTAMTDAKMKAAELDQLQLANEQQMRNKLIDQQMAVRSAEIDAAYKQGSLSLQQRNAEIDAWKAEAQIEHDRWLRKRTDRLDEEAKNATAGQTGPDLGWTEIVDPGKPITEKDDNGNDVVTGYATTWRLDPSFLAMAPKELVNETVKDIESKSSGYIALVKGLNSARTYLEQHPGANNLKLKPGGVGEVVYSEENREYQRRVNAAVMDFRHSMFAGNLTPNEQALIDQFNGQDYIFQRGSNGGKALDDLENLMRGKFEAAIESKQGVIVNPAPRPKRIDGLMNVTKARMAGNDAPPAKDTPGEEAVGRATGIDRNMDITGQGGMGSNSRTTADRSIAGLGAQAVTGMDRYINAKQDAVGIDRGYDTPTLPASRDTEPEAQKGYADAVDAIKALRELTKSGDADTKKKALDVIDRLQKKYPGFVGSVPGLKE